MRNTILASFALVIGALATVTTAGQAQSMTATGSVTYIALMTDNVERPDGTVLQRQHSRGVVLANDPTVPFHLSGQDCFGSTIVGSDGIPLLANGYCEGVDGDGDVWWIWWHQGPEANTWGFMGGTGKYEGIEGGGTTEPQVVYPDGRLVITWEGTWQIK